ncbi:Zn-finger domains containing protein [Halalkaliarchaeum sp. AArc-CO]|uniref:DUF7093 family protein n=1 Tax=unclassified Halalkaliarchaeum TaxID=2678344 RepID=UPI00217D2703|nr:MULTISPECIES: hypothetical protein [unclassified Halalkaliarchaeum]MDR5674396.1 hypothetical protein [Halalkaliarchaeum sp. AArc-GB]UWG52211.1 Zn-finger domains containing protein [Halalkaliarchaeum sp. AArc-CO]
MGLRCLLGHDFTEPELERDRETSGGEVVITVREVKTCRRCGETQIVSENKEVTSVEQLAETARRADDGDSSPESSPEPEPGAADAGTDELASGSPAEAPSEPDVGEEEIDEGSEVDPDDEVTVDASGESDADEGPAFEDDDVSQDAEEDDGIILDDEPTDSDRSPGAWPDASDTRQEGEDPTPDGVEGAAGDESAIVDETAEDDRAEPWPDQHGEDEGYDAEPGGGTPEGVSFGSGLRPEATDGQSPEDDEGVEFIESAGDVSGSGGAWPDPTDGAPRETADSAAGDTDDANGDDDRAEVSETDAAEDTEFTRAADAVDTSTGTPFETEFFCPECGHTAPTDGSSLRTGDICPECRRGYIAERERAPER